MIRRKEKREGIVPRAYVADEWASPLAMLNDMDRIFEDFRNEWESAFMVPRSFTSEATRQPLIDLTDAGKEYVVKAEMPGISKDGLDISVTEDGIEISGETTSEERHEDAEKGYIRRERHYSRFHRVLPLPDKVVADKAEAELKDGVLTVKLPKAAPPEKKTRKVQVK
ncbi:MAG: Hsp20/alpha crystallin family protein [Thermoplasmata archaeon]|nr:Hsp20/alpha crystallin family protein [Thermoplasmata archaeon]